MCHSSLALEREENVSVLVRIDIIAHGDIPHIALYGFSLSVEASYAPSCSGEPCAPRALSVHSIDAVAVCGLVHDAASEYVQLVTAAFVQSGKAYLTLVVVVHPHVVFGRCLYGKVSEVFLRRVVHASGVHPVSLHHLQSLCRNARCGVVGVDEIKFRSLWYLVARSPSRGEVVPVIAVPVGSHGLVSARVVVGLAKVYVDALRQTKVCVGPFQSVNLLYLHGVDVHHTVDVLLYYRESYVSVSVGKHYSAFQYLVVVAVVSAVSYALSRHLMESAPTVLTPEQEFRRAHFLRVAASESMETVAFILVKAAERYEIVVLERLEEDVVFGSRSHGKVVEKSGRR